MLSYICVVQVVLDTKMEALSTDDDGVGEEGEGVGISSLGELAAASRLVYVHQPTQRIGEYSVQSPLLASINTVSYTHTHTHTHTLTHTHSLTHTHTHTHTLTHTHIHTHSHTLTHTHTHTLTHTHTHIHMQTLKCSSSVVIAQYIL